MRIKDNSPKSAKTKAQSLKTKPINPTNKSLSNLLATWGLGNKESSTLEFKQTVPDPRRIAKTICGFANAHGGHIVIGITDKIEKVGVINPDAEKKRLLEAATYCQPAIDITFVEHIENNIIVIIAHIPEGKQKPYTALHPNGTWQTYIRTGPETVLASQLVKKSLCNEIISDNNHNTNSTNAHLRNFDSKELGLIEYLRTHPRITTKAYMQLMNLSLRRARRILIQLTLEGIIRQHDNNKEYYYTLS